MLPVVGATLLIPHGTRKVAKVTNSERLQREVRRYEDDDEPARRKKEGEFRAQIDSLLNGLPDAGRAFRLEVFGEAEASS